MSASPPPAHEADRPAPEGRASAPGGAAGGATGVAALASAGSVRWSAIAAGAGLLAAVLVFATAVGSVPLSPADVLRATWHGLQGELRSSADVIVWNIRLPRALLAATCGAALALAGVAYQGIFRNPLADPYLLGVASGGSFGAALVIAFGATSPWLLRLGVPAATFGAALATVGAVVLLARRNGRLPLLSLILAGVVLGSVFTAATSFVMLLARERATGVLAWLLGSFSLASWSHVATVVPIVVVAAIATLGSARALNVLQFGDDQARQLGLPVDAVKFGLITVATLATAAAVASAGVIGFVGLIVPHAARLAVGPDHRTLTPLAAVLGASFLVLADLLARTVIAPAELPIGVVTALVGGPFFLWLLRRQPRAREGSVA